MPELTVDRLEEIKKEADERPPIVTTHPIEPATIHYQIERDNFNWLIEEVEKGETVFFLLRKEIAALKAQLKEKEVNEPTL